MPAEENKEYVTSLGIKKAPTLLVIDGDKLEKYTDFSSILSFINKRG